MSVPNNDPHPDRELPSELPVPPEPTGPPAQDDLTGDLPVEYPDLGPDPLQKGSVDNTESEAALAFLEAGAPLQDGHPANPALVLAKLRRSAE